MRRRGPALAAALIGVLATAGTAAASHLAIDTEGHTTLDQILSPSSNPAAGYTTLDAEAVDESYLVRDEASEDVDGIPGAQTGREQRRRSLAYFSQMTDYQLADEESPARVEFLDIGASSAWRPWEALGPFLVDRAIRQVNRFAGASPVPQGDGMANSMDFALLTGDHADNSQRNETVWVRDLLEGNGPRTFNSGLTDPSGYTDPDTLAKPSCAAFLASKGGNANAAAAEGAGYTGVQDFDDYPGGAGNAFFYDPDDVQGQYATDGWPTYTGLMDTAQEAFAPAGLDVPSYLATGNHDDLVQGNEDANRAFEDIATSCTKALATSANPDQAGLGQILRNPSGPAMLIPPDEQRQFVSKPQIKQIYGANDPSEKHGYGFVDPDQNEFSNGSASYYAWDPPQSPGFRFISVDTTSEGGVLGPFGPQPTGSSDGNIDDPQFEWLKRELDEAQLAGKLIVLFAHHPVRTMDSVVPDEAAAPCSGNDAHGHDVNPGCDLDPRSSEPLHLGDPEIAQQFGSEEQTFTELVGKYPNVLAFVSGHTHENRVLPFEKQGGGVWWEINTSAVADYPQQHRLIEVMDNRDGTLSIFGTVLDHASPATAPPAGNASGFSSDQLASIGRTLAFNDPQIGAAATNGQAEGAEEDQNVELLLGDPKSLECKGRRATIVGSEGGDRIEGTPGGDVVVALGGNDKVKTGRDKDLVCGGRGDDKVKGGKGADEAEGEHGKDKLKGGKGRDTLKGKNGRDRLKGNKGRDLLKGGKGKDNLKGGKGRDTLKGGRRNDKCKGGGGRDRVSGC